ncbi:NUDIX hydrolase [Anaerolineales bacterium HSG24]|nr:NUDIX hydrolase [Anaerolineales bacterium HSG24]
MKPETVISKETLFEGHILGLELRQAKLPDGTPVSREVVINKGAVVIVPMTENNEVRLLKQYRAAVEKWIIELPAGGLELNEDPDLAAPRELLEETGDQAGTWQKLGGFYSAPGILTEYLHLYLATDLTAGENRLEFDEHIAEVLTVPWAEAIAMIRSGEIEDGKTIAGLMMAGIQLELIS